MASFKDQLKGFKSLLSRDDEEDKARAAAQARKEEEARQARAALGQRLLQAGASVRASHLEQNKQEGKEGEDAAPRCMALLILILDALPFEAQWREWLRRTAGRTQVKVWIHAKFPDRVSSAWVKARLVPTSFRPEWGSVEITRAELELLRVALDDEEASIQRFLLASESCLPILPLDQAAEALFATAPHSWVNYRNTPNNGYSNQQQFVPLVDKGVPPDRIGKADQWVALTRAHAQAILALPKALGEDLWPLFKRVSASDEMYFPTCLALLGALGNSGSSQDGKATAPDGVAKRRVTYCHWGDSPKSPETYQGLHDELLTQASAEGCLFARKFKSGSVSLEAWLVHMQRVEGDKGETYGDIGKEEGEEAAAVVVLSGKEEKDKSEVESPTRKRRKGN